MTSLTTPTRVGFHELETNQLVPSTLNPRKRARGIADLAASIREAGIIEPLLVRPTVMITDDDAPVYEVIAGSRRLAAAAEAGLLFVPCLVRELTDAQALELAIIENNQRGDVHPLEEAEAFQHLRRLDRAYTPEIVAAKIGRPLAYVKSRLRLLNLTGEAREAFADEEITIGHAERLARLAPDVQERALAACFSPMFGREDGAMGLAAINALDNWITEHTVIDVKSPEVQEDLPELVEAVDRLEAEGATIVQLSTGHDKRHGLTGKAAPLPMGTWIDLRTEKRCKCATKGVVVYGERHRAEILDVCLKSSKCQTHWKTAPAAAAKGGGERTKQPWEIENEKRAADRAIWETQADEALTAIAASLKGRKADLSFFLAHVEPHDRPEVAKYLCADVTEKNVGQALWFHEVLQIGTYDPARLSKEVKDVTGFDLLAWRKAWAKAHPSETPAAAAPKTAAKKAAKKR